MHRLPLAFRLRQLRPPPCRNFSLLPRRHQPLSRAGANPGQHGAIRTQPVRFQKGPFFTTRRAVTWAIYFTAFYTTLNLVSKYIDIEIEMLEDEEEDEEDAGQVQEGGDGREITPEEEESGIYYADPSSTFIPLTWSKKLPRTFYKGSDPEWQSFLAIAKDKPRHTALQTELLRTVFTGAQQHPLLARQLGKDPKIGKYWLDISFPDGPPQEYERQGIEIGEGFVAWSRQKIDAEAYWRVRRAVWPRAVAESAWKAGRVLGAVQWRRVKEAMGWEVGVTGGPADQYFKHIERVLAQRAGKQGGSANGIERQQTPETTATAADQPNAPARPSPPARDPNQPHPLGLLSNLPLPNANSNPLIPPTDLALFTHIFQASLSQRWNDPSLLKEPPRGSFLVSGLVELRGQKGRVVLDVRAAYDPKQSKYTHVNAGVRTVKGWRQGPKGGP